MANSFLSFREIGPSVSGKTRRFAVLSKSQGAVLGTIEWYGPWRQYCFNPDECCVFSPGCLDDISAFIKSKMRERTQVTA